MPVFFAYFKHLFILILAIVSIFFIGQFFLSYFFPQINRKNKFFKLFTSFLVGFICCLTFFAIYKSHLITINLLCVILFFMALFEYYFIEKKYFNFSLKKIKIWIPDFKTTLLLLAFILLIFSYESFFILQSNSFPFVMPFYDATFYAEISESLKVFGQENSFNKYIIFDNIYNGTSLYHFSDLWFSSLISSVFNVSSLLSLILISYPLLIFIFVIGIIAIFEIFKKIHFYHCLIALFVLFCGGLYFYFYDSWHFLSINFIGDSFPLSFLGRKLLIVYIILVAVIILVLKKQYTLALIAYWGLIPLYSTTLIGVIGGTGFLVLMFIFFNKILNKKFQFNINIIRIIIYFLIILLGTFLFTFLTSSPIDIRALNKPSEIILSFLPQLPFRTYIILFFETFVRLLIYYFPYIPLLIFFFLLKKNMNLKAAVLFFFILFIVGGGLSSVLFSIINHPKMNYWQAFYNFYLPVLSVGMSLIFIIVISHINKNRIKLFLILYFLGLCSYQFFKTVSFNIDFKYNKIHQFYKKNEYSNNYISNLNIYFKSKQINNSGIQLSGTKLLLEGYYEVLSPFLYFNNNYISGIDLSPFTFNFSIEELNFTAKEFVSLHPFYRFIQKSKAEGTFVNVDEEMIKFVKHHSYISYMIAAKNVEIYPPLEEMFTLITTDELSGERFYIRKKG